MSALKRIQKVQKLFLSEHTLDIDIKKCKTQKFRFSEIEDYVRAITGEREYQFQAIKHTMIYLWGGIYKDVTELASENFERKIHIKERFGSQKIMYGHLPLADRLSGVVHMATGTGKSYVIFAVAYLSLVMGLTKRVLVLGPSSTIIEEGLRDKFQKFLNNKTWNDCLPKEYQGKAIDILTNNDAIEDGSITIENINAIYTDGGIIDTLFKNTEEVLVLGDEIHHAYSHLKFNDKKHELELDKDIEVGKSKKADEKDERIWMQFLKKNTKIKRHIGFTGTPYNRDDYFADVIFDYNIRTAINDNVIKDINPIIDVKTNQGQMQWTTDKRFEVVLLKHLENSDKYAYKDIKRNRKVKPITVFYCPTQANAKNRSEEFIKFLAKWYQVNKVFIGSLSQLEQIAREKVICVVSSISVSVYKNELDNIEEIDPNKVGGKVEFIFSVGKLLEGWDVDNVFQIVPMEERIFNSKLLISQVLGRGLRIPRNISFVEIQQLYPMLTVTNHEKFANHITELMDAVTKSDVYITSEPLKDSVSDNCRSKHHFSVFNLNYLSTTRIEDNTDDEQSGLPFRELSLTKNNVNENVIVERIIGTDKYALKKKTFSVESIVDAIYRRFLGREYEGIRFDFGSGPQNRCPTEIEIRNVIISAMNKARISDKYLAEENKKQIDLYFNQFLPRGKKKRVFENILGDIVPISTKELECSSVKVGEFERDATAFISKSYKIEVDNKTKTVIDYLENSRMPLVHHPVQQTFFFFDPQHFLQAHKNYVQPLIQNDDRPPYIVNTDVFKTPQSTILVSHSPEKEFVFRLLENSTYLDSWIKSTDKGFYSIDYEYWKGGKDRVRRGFNPDFFIKIGLDEYLKVLKINGKSEGLEKLKELQEKGYEYIIRVVEIKSDEDDDEATPAKAEYAKSHFESVNEKLSKVNPVDIPEEHIADLKSYYMFDLLKPGQFQEWFQKICDGNLEIVKGIGNANTLILNSDTLGSSKNDVAPKVFYNVSGSELVNVFIKFNKKSNTQNLILTFSDASQYDESDSIIEFLSRIADLAGFDTNAILPVYHLSNETPPTFVNKKDWEENFPEGLDIDNILGLYTPQNETITIFEKAIKWVNKHRNVNENSLREIVYIHELAHWISHKLPHPNSPEWRLRDYIITDTFVHESWAQLLTYWGVKYISLKYKNKNLEEIFLKFWSPLTSIDEKDIQKLKNRWFALYRFYGRINEIKPDRKTEVFESLIELRKIKNGAHIEEWINFLI